MSVKIIVTKDFKRLAKSLLKKYASLKEELSELLVSLGENPALGIPLGENIYKIKIGVRSKGKGKSGGVRVITFVEAFIDIEVDDEDVCIIHLIAIYDKSEIYDIGKKDLLDMIDGIEPED